MLMQDQDDPTVAFLQISLITIADHVPRSFAYMKKNNEPMGLIVSYNHCLLRESSQWVFQRLLHCTGTKQTRAAVL